ncbi:MULTISPECIES: hypothetical protein [Idiomarina]|uniref:hypothetical protein n=1 Tax=Idiomarina TaxID=135575 RepID=UPI000C387940|nr:MULTISPECIES: hypothetical protein [Idiomarina]MBP59440.1 hypothetical protein [Idiomarina sp.]|tara:strand:+ start:12269 stop:13735 length:1467 start_codon:yes stop_codon:yes gene_type:complete
MISSSLREVGLPEFISQVIGSSIQSHRDVRSLYGAKLSDELDVKCDTGARNASSFKVVTPDNIIALSRDTFDDAVYGNSYVDDDFIGEEMYFTPNGFSEASRVKLAELSELCCVWVDLDVRDPDIERGLTAHEVRNIQKDFYESLENEKTIPIPDFIVSSGSGGLHLYWTFKAELANSRTITLWKLLKDKLNMLLTRPSKGGMLFVDEKGNDSPKRIMRIPGSINIKYREICRAFQSDRVKHRRALGDLIQQLKINPNQQASSKLYKNYFNPKLIRSSDFCRDNFRLPDKLSNHQFWCLRYANFVVPMLMDGLKVKRGYRDLIAYSVVVSLRQLGCPRNLIREIIVKVNFESIGLPTKTLLDYMSTAMKRLYRANSSEFIRNFFLGTGVNAGHLAKKRKLSKKSRQEHLAEVSSARRRQTIDSIILAVRKIALRNNLSKPLTITELARESGTSRVTLYKCGINGLNLWACTVIICGKKYASPVPKGLL